MEKITTLENITLYIDTKKEACVDIDVPNEINEVLFPDAYYYNNKRHRIFYDLRKVKKQFPNITTLIISKGIPSTFLRISNMMFPNVEKVVSYSPSFVSGPMLLSTQNELYNTFCKNEEFVIDMKNVKLVEQYAFEGCRSTNMVNIPEKLHAKENAFANSAIKSSGKFFKNGALIIGNTVVDTDERAEQIWIPENAYVSAYVGTFDLSIQNKEIIVNKTNQIREFHFAKGYPGIIRNNDCSYVSLQKMTSCLTEAKTISYQIADKNKWYCSVDGVIYTKDKRILVRFPSERTGVFKIPEGVKKVADYSFVNCMVEEVIFPESLVDIGDSAFLNCKNLQTFKFNTERAVNVIGSFVFADCTGLKTIEVPPAIVSIAPWMFHQCNPEDIILHEGLEIIEDNAFRDCKSVKSLHLPSTLRAVKEGNFTNVSELHAKSRTPDGILKSILNSLDDAATYKKKSLIVKLVISDEEKDYIFYLPRNMDKDTIAEIDEFFSTFPPSLADEDITCKLFQMCLNRPVMQDTAIELFHITNDRRYWEYIKKSRQSIAKRLLSEKEEKKLTTLIGLGIFTRKNLEELLKTAQADNMTTLAAYIVNELGKTAKSNFSVL